MIKLKILRWHIILDFLSGAHVITKIPTSKRWRQESQRRRCDVRSRGQRGEKLEDARLLPLNMEKGAGSKE